MRSRPTLLAAASLLLLAAAVKADTCGSAVGAACCPAGSPGAPAGVAVPFCVGADLICFSSPSNPTPNVCQPYPRDCGASGQQCCPGRYHNPVDKPLPPRCASAGDWCDGRVCVTNPPDCGELGKAPCYSGGDVSTQPSCKRGPDGVKLGLTKLGDKVCGYCPSGMHVGNNGADLCVA